MAKTGIELTNEALSAFLRAKSASDSVLSSSSSSVAFTEQDKIRWIKVRILLDHEPPIMDLVETHPLSDISSDYNAMSESVAKKPLAPCYFFFRLDTTVSDQNQNYEWLLIWYVPERAKVREKMLYSSSMAGLKAQIGFSNSLYGANIWAGDYHTVCVDDLKYQNFSFVHKSQRHIHDIELYTEQERQKLMEEKEAFDQIEKDAESKSPTTQPTSSSSSDSGSSGGASRGVSFPFEESAKRALSNLEKGTSLMVVLKIDTEKEIIVLSNERTGNNAISVEELKENISDSEPRYIFFHFQYEHEENQGNSGKTVFIYSCPTKSKVKQRMLASASKGHVVQTATSSGVLKLEASLEISDVEDLTHEFLVKYIHPPKSDSSLKFSKPKRAGRGTARVAKIEE
ncbi:hypothetical protein NAEGRDRAFT_58328 [Naegleria gruberi]|uniref:Uncharacterized protein AM4 n=1 Tax=Naegleria gruberi TaxID=5762 RepID=D2VIP7_NAEGR|nr:uncharacterized protein NAEGRDRAFT_58328 [Naegleria gruberi]EFC43388.1 hypothetical protein NAEGRDRAFT_58328 [Naegleria gruberi]|eukprot:XP_002676132.1 hypothetical protein NAEGRDRAFT_58328 [Naegleria gruberi strain NEG-M]